MMFGIVFQECFVPKIHNSMSLFSMLRILWVITSMLLVMAFIGNLKSSLILNNYYERTMTFEEIFEKDLPFHSSQALYDFLNSPSALNSPVNRRLLCQANKKGSMVFPNR